MFRTLIILHIYILVTLVSGCGTGLTTGPVHLNKNSADSGQNSASLATSSAADQEIKIEAVIKSVEKLTLSGRESIKTKDFWHSENILAIPYLVLEPGEYEIKIHASWDKYWVNSGFGYANEENFVRIKLKAGHKYIPKIQQSDTGFSFLIVDLGVEFSAKCFPFFQKNILAKMDIGRSKANELINYAKKYGCDWK